MVLEKRTKKTAYLCEDDALDILHIYDESLVFIYDSLSEQVHNLSMTRLYGMGGYDKGCSFI